MQVHPHMSFLNSSRDQGAYRRKILHKPSSSYDLHQGCSIRIAQHFQRSPGQGMKCGQSTNRTDSQGNFQFKLKLSVLNRTLTQPFVSPGSRCPGMSAGFYSAEIIGRSQHYRINAIEDPLIMGGRPVGINMRDPDGRIKSSGKFFRTQSAFKLAKICDRTFDPNMDPAVGRLIGKNGHDHFWCRRSAGGIFFKPIGHGLCTTFENRINKIGPHGITGFSLHK